MEWHEILIIAVALAMDALAASVASGIAIRNLKIRHALTIAAYFGFFQSLMPLIGWFAGLGARSVIPAYDHWIAFLLLLGIGGRTIYESFQLEKAEKKRDPLNIFVLLALSIATSIDACATGITFAMLGVKIIAPSLAIGAITFAICLGGVYSGNKGRHLGEKKVEFAAGIVLIAIGLKILLSHCFAQDPGPNAPVTPVSGKELPSAPVEQMRQP